ncbi:AAA family ATPase [Aquirufa antheringensis]|uniref:AAA family ATPase n=1 Tax=Aquirufa antheringensis TaxID=2516559 RepID=UPI003BB14EEE
MKINPNSDKNFIDNIDLSREHNFPKFLKSITLSPFRHINNLTVNFNHPISVVAGTNRSGKSTILMALACSHFDFKKRNIQNGVLERHTWSSIMQFTGQDKQTKDWTYYITYKIGTKEEVKKGQRSATTKKWNGIGKKETQFKNRQVTFLDLSRVFPARNFGKVLFNKSQKAIITNISNSNFSKIEEYLSFILEEKFTLKKIASHQDKDIFKYSNENEYSSYNAATGEEVLTKIIIDVVEAPNNSLVLIDEIEIGLHPKIQRRLIQLLYFVARNDSKQFILTTHSSTILSSLPDNSRIFIEQKSNGNFNSIPNISVNASLSKMDSISYPLFDLYCEDDIAKKIIEKAIFSIQTENSLTNFNDLINIIVSGSNNKTYLHFISHKETYPYKRIKVGFACILDGDCKKLKNKDGNLLYATDECLHFLYSEECPEKFLVSSYLEFFPNKNLNYHLDHSDPHCLFNKMVELSICISTVDAFEKTWESFLSSSYGYAYFKELKKFILNMSKKYSPDL